MCETCDMISSDFVPLLRLAKEAVGNGPEKWKANAELMEWFRASNCVEVIMALQAAAHVCERPGGRNNAHMIQTIQELKPLGYYQAVQ